MPSDGDSRARIESSLRLVRSAIDLDSTLENALIAVPTDLRDRVRELWLEETQEVTFSRIVHVSDPRKARGVLDRHDPAQGYHWRRLRNWLANEGYKKRIVESLDDTTDRILTHFGDPTPNISDNFRIQGLVIGQVQSGKTANYTALIAKAVDAGYKLIIVLAGIHNQLRWQTQRRLTKDLGLDEIPGGIGVPAQEYRWSTITKPDVDGDFRPGTVQAGGLGAQPVVAVVKKNATVLSRLLKWLQGRPKPDHLPTLIIDDESDQASTNIGVDRDEIDEEIFKEIVDLTDDDIERTTFDLKDELKPSTINKLIRSLIKEFDKICYVAYTATPFANVLQEPLGKDYEAGDSLYPRDFIISIPISEEYIGAEQLFGLRDDLAVELDVISIVNDLDASYLNPNKEDEELVIPISLKESLLDFILASAAKDYRDDTSGKSSPATMLIHTSRRTFAQIKLGEMVREEIRYVRNLWRYRSDDDLQTETLFKDRWHAEFQLRNEETSSLSFNDIRPYIDEIFKEGIPVSVFNSETTDQLGHDNDPYQKVIVIGGNRLSRGITLEGLIVSYYTRKSNYYDTIMQSGRWFGYRPGYGDLTRIWTTHDIYRYFRHLALVEEDIREQLEIFEQTDKTPTDVSPLILAHPVLSVTAPNRMGSAQQYYTSFAGQFLQSVRLHLDNTDILINNLSATRNFVESLGSSNVPEDLPKRHTWKGIHWEKIISYLNVFSVPSEAANFRPIELAEYIRRQAEETDELIQWWISVISLSRFDKDLGDIDLAGSIGRVNAISRSRLKWDRHSVGVLANPTNSKGNLGDDTVGLTKKQINVALNNHKKGLFQNFSTALRHQRNPTEGLLCIYPISQYSTSNRKTRVSLFDNASKGVPVIGLAILFPTSRSIATKSYIGGPLAGEQG